MQAQPGMANGVNQMQRNGTPGSNNIPPQMANPSLQQGQNGPAMAARAHQTQQGMQANFANGNMSGMSMGTPGVPQAQMQGNMQNAQRMGPPDQIRMAMQRGQFQNANQQHQFQLQQQQLNMASNLTQGMGINGIPNANMMASMPNQNLNGAMNGNMNNAMNGMSNTAGSPRMNQANGSMQTPARPLSSGHMPQLLQFQNQIKVQHPDWTTEQVSKQASDHLSRFLAKQRTQAMNAAAGSPGMSPTPQLANNNYFQQNGGMANTPQPTAVQNYQQQLVQQQRLMSQQQARQQASSPGLSVRPPSRSATPQNPQMQQSPGMQQAQINRS
jgi:chromatin modification-related protein VID21